MRSGVPEIILVIALKEGSEGQHITMFLETWLPDILALETKSGTVKIDRAHRALGPFKENRIRPIIIK